MNSIIDYRGHIRNWKQLCEELEIADSLAREEREREIVLKAYEKWGHDVANHIYGMFAFAINDEAENKIFAVRDQFGTKPFYYYVTADNRLLCGTYIRTIMEQEGFVKELNEKMLQVYYSVAHPMRRGEETFFKGTQKSSCPVIGLNSKDRKLTVERYWDGPHSLRISTKSLDDWADEIHSTLAHIMTDVKEPNEVAESFLSGGVDSADVLAMSDAKRADSCGYDEERFDESRVAAKTAELLGVEHSVAKIQPKDFFGIVPYVMYNMEQPLGDASAIVFTLGCLATAKHTKLCYSGRGCRRIFRRIQYVPQCREIR